MKMGKDSNGKFYKGGFSGVKLQEETEENDEDNIL